MTSTGRTTPPANGDGSRGRSRGSPASEVPLDPDYHVQRWLRRLTLAGLALAAALGWILTAGFAITTEPVLCDDATECHAYARVAPPAGVASLFMTLTAIYYARGRRRGAWTCAAAAFAMIGVAGMVGSTI